MQGCHVGGRDPSNWSLLLPPRVAISRRLQPEAGLDRWHCSAGCGSAPGQLSFATVKQTKEIRLQGPHRLEIQQRLGQPSIHVSPSGSGRWGKNNGPCPVPRASGANTRANPDSKAFTHNGILRGNRTHSTPKPPSSEWSQRHNTEGTHF